MAEGYGMGALTESEARGLLDEQAAKDTRQSFERSLKQFLESNRGNEDLPALIAEILSEHFVEFSDNYCPAHDLTLFVLNEWAQNLSGLLTEWFRGSDFELEVNAVEISVGRSALGEPTNVERHVSPLSEYLKHCSW